MTATTIPVPFYRALVVCGKRLRSQWVAESAKFAPDAVCGLVEGKHAMRDLIALADRAVAENRPMVGVATYDAIRDYGDDFREFFVACGGGDDIACDEAVVLKNPNSGRSKALWDLREVFQVAIPMTGTPIEKSVDDLGAILAWARNDRGLFHGLKLSKQFDTSDPASVAELWDALGPTVFRRDRSEIADELPRIETDVVLIDPEPAERKLAEAARHQLKQILAELSDKIKLAAELDPSDPKLAAARKELQSLRGTALGGVTLARKAACDPVAVAESDSVGRELLNAQGLIAPAVRTGGTKRKVIVDTVVEMVANGESVLIMTDFSSVADHLVADLQAAGVRTASIQGGMSDKRASDAQDGFQGGPGGTIGPDVRYDCLVLTKTANKGLNLQRASVLFHYDLPWLASEMVQRVGRASRIGSTAGTLQVIIPIMTGTIEERAAKLLVTRATEALSVLDNPRGVDTRKTEFAQSLAGLSEAVSDAEIEEGEQGMLELAKALIG